MTSADQSQPVFRPVEHGHSRPTPALPHGPVAGRSLSATPAFRSPHDGYGQPAGESYGQSYGHRPSRSPEYPAVAPLQPLGAAPPQPLGPAPPAFVHPQQDRPRPSRSWSRLAGRFLAVALVAVLAWQAYQIDRLSERLREVDRLEEADAVRVGGLDGRIGQLEQQAGRLFDPEAISAAVLPSVFRVSAGPVTGTAFAVGKPAAGGGTNLFTNWHVVEPVWKRGGRKVFLERSSQRFTATIVKVDKEHDVAHLRSDARFTGLRAARTPVKSGQQILVAGAPLGLTDSVTTGVVSAQRTLPDLAGSVIQFDAPINPGNSGGPVVNGAKQVVGIATAKQRDAEGIGLAVPIKTACDEFDIC